MATGDRIMIADKATLDAVKQDTSTLMTKSDEIKSAMNSGESINNTRRSKIIYGSKLSGASTWVDVLNLPNSSGKLHLVIMNCQPSNSTDSSNTSTVQILVDGTTIYNGTISLTANVGVMNMCLVDKSSILGLDGSTRMLLINNQVVHIGTYGALPYSASLGSSPVVISSEPIKWNTSLQIRAQGNRVAGTVFYYYELD